MSTKRKTEDQGDVAIAEGAPKEAQPPQYAVLLHNDDYTTMEFVVDLLKTLFRKTQEEAIAVMLSVHEKGKGVAGIYDFEIAETKAMQATERARTQGYPLKCTVERA